MSSFILSECIQGDCENGQGIYTFPNGDKYVGEYRNNHRYGYGTYIWGLGPNEDDKYAGEWKNGLPDGQGTYTWSDGKNYVGEWKNGLFHGYGIFTYSDGRVQQGKWHFDDFVE